ncbi:MAG TPA: phage tail tape measure C-terminal domain-containing protein, partial [Candidatus Angelobacter sp.]|nr:phage tail tape measure C-terminal domain-containing protein [Candidatus Angelobacter sp.]
QKEWGAEMAAIDHALAANKKQTEDKDLNDFDQYVRQQVYATKAGSKERLAIYDGALEIMRGVGATETREYKALLDQRAIAFREYTDKEIADAQHAAQVKRQILEIGAEAAKQHVESLEALFQSELDFERQLGLISEGEYEKRLQAQLEQTYRAARAELQVKLDAAKQGTADYARILAEITKLDDKHRMDLEKAEQQSYARRHAALLQFVRQSQNLNQEIEQTFIQNLNSMNQQLATFITTGQANWSQLATSAIEEIIKIGLQWVESQLLMKLFGIEAKKTELETSIATIVAEIQAQAQLAGATAYAFNAWDPPAAATAAAAAIEIVSGFGIAAAALGGAGSAAGGQWEVPGIQPTILHPQEMVLPASLASRMRNVIELGGGLSGGGGGGGITVVVNHSVSAVDAESFQGTIKKHSNMIGNEVARILKKKGLGAK